MTTALSHQTKHFNSISTNFVQACKGSLALLKSRPFLPTIKKTKKTKKNKRGQTDLGFGFRGLGGSCEDANELMTWIVQVIHHHLCKLQNLHSHMPYLWLDSQHLFKGKQPASLTPKLLHMCM
jgi:hypothetical protein